MKQASLLKKYFTPVVPGQWMLAVGLGTFHVALLLVLAIVLIFRGGSLGDLLDGLNTFVGSGVFLLLWAASVGSTFRALCFIGLERGDVDIFDAPYWGHGAFWGGVAGMAFLLGVVISASVVLIPYAVVTEGRGELPLVIVAAIVGGVGSCVAFIIGGVVGLIFALIDGVLIKAVRSIMRMPPVLVSSPETPEA